jgi:hypothetical protein
MLVAPCWIDFDRRRQRPDVIARRIDTLTVTMS